MFRAAMNGKIGSLIAYIAMRVQPLSLTKLLKLLFIIDQESVKDTGVPMTWLEYKAWAEGPVAKDIYDEIKYDTNICVSGVEVSLDDYIVVLKEYNTTRNQEEVYIESVENANTSALSRFEKSIVDAVLGEYGKMPASRLIEILHQEGGLWDLTVKRNNLEPEFTNATKKSNVTINLSELIHNNELLSLASKAAYDSLNFHEQLAH